MVKEVFKGSIGVLFGGDSQEREVSLNSGKAVYESLKKQGVTVKAIDICQENKTQNLKQLQEIDLAFIALHGRGGEDGKIQGVLDFLGVPYTGSSVASSALAMDKLITKQIWTVNNLPTPLYQRLDETVDLLALVEKLGFPMMIKPAHEGSSIGISKVSSEKEFLAAYQVARKFDSVVIAEKWIEGKEYTVSLVGENILPIIRLETPREFYDYEAKYKLDNTQYHCPSGLNQSLENELKKLAKQAFDVLGCSGWGRVDFLLDNKEKPWLIELNTVPGLTSHSLVPMAAKQQGLDFEQLINLIIHTSIK